MTSNDHWHANFYRYLDAFLASRSITDSVLMDATIDGHALNSKPLLNDAGKRVVMTRKLLLRDFRQFLEAAGVNRPSDLHHV